jgi:hypothetical protein
MLKKQVSPKIVAIVFAVIVVCFAIVVYVSAWTEPSVVPPGANVPAPLNISNVGQSKSGGLILNTGGTANGLIVDQDNVGIGTITPAALLDIRSTILSSASANINIMGYRNVSVEDQAYGGIMFYNRWASLTNPTAQILTVQDVNQTRGALTFWTRGSEFNERMRITEGGQVGIGTGTNNIDQQLEVNGAIESSNLFSHSENVASSQSLTVSFPVGASGMCVVTVPPQSYEVALSAFFSTSTTSIEIVRLGQLGGANFIANSSSTSNKMKIKLASVSGATSFCYGNDCTYNISCFGYNLYPATVTSEP